MRLPRTLLLLLLLPLTSRRVEAQRDGAGLGRAFAGYDSTFRRQDPAGIAAWFLPNGEMGSVGHPTIVGPDSIAATLRRFAEFRLLASTLLPDSMQVTADSALIGGRYWQRVRLPAGDTVEAHGLFSMTWVWTAGAEWRIRRLVTDP